MIPAKNINAKSIMTSTFPQANISLYGSPMKLLLLYFHHQQTKTIGIFITVRGLYVLLISYIMC